MPATIAAVGLGLQAASMVFGFMSGNEAERAAAKAAKQQHEMDLKNWEFNWQEAQDAYQYQLDDRDITLWNLASQQQLQRESSIREWIDADKLRVFDYKNQIDAYNASIDTYDDQLEFNNISSSLAANARQRAYQDQLDVIGFQHEDILISEAEREEQAALKVTDIDAAYGIKKKEYEEAEGFEAKRLNLTKKEIQDRAEKVKEELSIQKEELKDLHTQDNLLFTSQLTREQKVSGYKKAELDHQLTKATETARITKEEEIVAGKRAAGEAKRIAKLGTAEGIVAAEQKRGLEKSLLRNTLAQRRQQTRTDREKNRLEALSARGQTKNIGQKGRTARKNIVQTYQKQGLVNQALSDSFARYEKEFDINILRVDEDFRAIKAKLDIENARIDEAEKAALERFDLLESRTTVDETYQKSRIGTAKETETEQLRHAEETIGINKEKARLRKEAGVDQITKREDVQQLLIDQATDRYDLGELIRGERLDEASELRIREKAKVTKMEELAVLRDEFSERQLLRNLTTQGEQFDIDFQKLALDKYQQDIVARSRIAPEPLLAPQAQLPETLELPTLGAPRAPRKGPRPIKYASTGAGMGLAGLAGGMGGLASATTAYAAHF